MCIKLFHKEPRPDFTRRPHVRNVLYYCFPPKKDNEADDTNILISQSDKISIETYFKNRPASSQNPRENKQLNQTFQTFLVAIQLELNSFFTHSFHIFHLQFNANLIPTIIA
jgi:hypothetical protein